MMNVLNSEKTNENIPLDNLIVPCLLSAPSATPISAPDGYPPFPDWVAPNIYCSSCKVSCYSG